MENNFIVVSYYTKEYENEAKKLIASLEKFKLHYDVELIDGLGSWQKNTQYKPKFCKKMLEKHQRPIVYLDADAEVKQYPDLFNRLDCDIAVHYRNSEELLSGTLYLDNIATTKAIIEDWVREIERNPNIWEQACLARVLERYLLDKALVMEQLPPEYCCIFDLMSGVKNPVIVQHQASRKLKENVNGTL